MSSAFDILYFDVGHTLAWPHLQGMADMGMRILKRPVTQAQLIHGDRVARRMINRFVRDQGHASTMPTGSGPPTSMAAYYEELIFAVLHQPNATQRDDVRELMQAWWEYQVSENWFSILGVEVIAALDRLSGVERLGIISNSEGRINRLLTMLGIRDAFDIIIDSGVEGVCKPDPAIFRLAAERAETTPDRCLFIGDQPDVDVKGGLAAGMRVIHYDPQETFGDRYVDDVPVCRNLLAIADGTAIRELIVNRTRTI